MKTNKTITPKAPLFLISEVANPPFEKTILHTLESFTKSERERKKIVATPIYSTDITKQ